MSIGPKTQEHLDELEAEFREAKAAGELGRAVRLLTKLNSLRSDLGLIDDEEDEDDDD